MAAYLSLTLTPLNFNNVSCSDKPEETKIETKSSSSNGSKASKLCPSPGGTKLQHMHNMCVLCNVEHR